MPTTLLARGGGGGAGGCTLRRGHIPIILTQQNTAIHKCSQATNFSSLNWSWSPVRLVVCVCVCVRKAGVTSLFARWPDWSVVHSRLAQKWFSWPWCQPHIMTLCPFVFAGGAWPLRPWMHTTTPPRMTWSCLQEFSRLPSTIVRGLRRSYVT